MQMMMIPAYNYLIDFVEDYIAGTTNVLLKAAAEKCKIKLLSYYSKTDDILHYNVGLVLDPRMKTAYHDAVNWETKYETQAKDMLQGLYEQYNDNDDMTATTTDNQNSMV
ncbi:hypothetical protein BCR42DRAFT_444621 [Absidia repens]|uniref:hAT-like transposase RNase-H fold domain-containing protein n=1 Tax=Absidia repens TaxID=90262 RepID=A0A1X2HKB7_9FUNG|nr:hypothetical protein BCR42DRAFT_444621 [Absidia repens]